MLHSQLHSQTFLNSSASNMQLTMLCIVHSPNRHLSSLPGLDSIRRNLYPFFCATTQVLLPCCNRSCRGWLWFHPHQLLMDVVTVPSKLVFFSGFSLGHREYHKLCALELIHLYCILNHIYNFMTYCNITL